MLQWRRAEPCSQRVAPRRTVARGGDAVRAGPVCPNLCGPNFFAACVSAAWLGGLPLMRGMTIAAGLIEIVFARVLRRLAFLFPAQITGLVVFMVALSVVPVGSSAFLHVSYDGEPIQPMSLAIAAITLLTMVGLNIWAPSRMKLYGVLIGLAVGYALSAAAGLIDPVQYRGIAQAPWIGLPQYTDFLRLSFDWSMLPVFTSSLALSTVLAVALNQLFRLGAPSNPEPVPETPSEG